ncbi:MAG: hypothetical protein RLZZ241_2530 [Bacteroidota bacterium]|jgi:hypothetical protein
MSIKALGAKLFALYTHFFAQNWINNPHRAQRKTFNKLIRLARNTRFGMEHQFHSIDTYADFARNVPVRDYEGLKPYVEAVLKGETNVLWPDQPLYFAKTSGTTSGAKYIPITKVSIREQVRASRNAILNYLYKTGNSAFVNGKMIFLQGSPEMDEKNGIKVGRLSGITAHYVPAYLQKNRLPSWETNCIEDWETKVDKIVEETISQDMTVIAGIPSWVQMYFEKLQEKSNKSIRELFPNFKLFIYGGVNYEPYRSNFENLIGDTVDSIELFPASEGFFAYQDVPGQEGLLLLLDAGIFYEFIAVDDFQQEHPRRLSLEGVELGVNYVMIISTNAGLWGYNLGDTVRFVSLKPYRIVVTGRIKHFISAFGEHVIAKEVETAMQHAQDATGARVSEFTVAPMITPPDYGLPYHEWFVEFEQEPEDLDEFIQVLDQSLQTQNSYYYDLIIGKVLRPLKINKIRKGGFLEFMKSLGKLGGQNKVQRLSNDRKIADALRPMLNKE